MGRTDTQRTIGALQLIGGVAGLVYGGGYGGGGGGGYLIGSGLQNLSGDKKASGYVQGKNALLGDVEGSFLGHGYSGNTWGNVGGPIGGLLGGTVSGSAGGLGAGGSSGYGPLANNPFGFGGTGTGSQGATGGLLGKLGAQQGPGAIGSILGGNQQPQAAGAGGIPPPITVQRPSTAPGLTAPTSMVTATPQLASGGSPQQIALLTRLLAGQGATA